MTSRPRPVTSRTVGDVRCRSNCTTRTSVAADCGRAASPSLLLSFTVRSSHLGFGDTSTSYVAGVVPNHDRGEPSVNTRSRRLPILAGVLALSLIAASCGDDDDESTADTSAETTAGSGRDRQRRPLRPPPRRQRDDRRRSRHHGGSRRRGGTAVRFGLRHRLIDGRAHLDPGRRARRRAVRRQPRRDGGGPRHRRRLPDVLCRRGRHHRCLATDQ